MRKSRLTVTTIGLGYIGLPTSALIASKGISVHGVDLKEKVVETVNEGRIPFYEPSLDEVVKFVVSEGYLKASTKIKMGNVYLIVVPTPFTANNKPDISFVIEATQSVIPVLKEGDLFIIESTSPVGTTERIGKLIYDKRPDLIEKIFIAYCPERVLPGNIMYELVHNDRVIGGIDERSTLEAVNFYRQFVKGKLNPTNSKTAEMCKLVENSFRDVQIAFANELSMLCEKAEINIWELITLANKHPRVNILKPGCGVGGHCIAVDPYFLIADFPEEAKLIAKARNTNNFKTSWCIDKIVSDSSDFENRNKRKPKIALMGLAFKPNVDDLRESPAIFIAEKLLDNFGEKEILVVEPNIQSHSYFNIVPIKKAIDLADIIVFLVAHKEFGSLKIKKSKLIIDFCGVMT